LSFEATDGQKTADDVSLGLVLSHGLPYPENLGLANSLEDIVRRGGCVPCTIAILDGKIHYGLNATEIERLALAGKHDGPKPSEKIHKASVRDLGWILSQKACGATTVAATSFLASKIGVRVFATGGIGGVHRDGHITMDVSADLVEMSRSPVVVVCAGAKSILDISRTLEYLETLGVPVIGYNTNEFPAFFTRKSGCEVPLRLDDAESIAKLMKSSMELAVGRGVLVAVPISEKDEADAIEVERAIQQALKEAEEKKIHGRDITPFILGRVSQLTGGHSLKANIALLQQNAGVAAQISKALASLETKPTVSSSSICPVSSFCHNPNNNNCTCSSSTRGPYSEQVAWKYSKVGNEEPKVSCTRDVYRHAFCPKTGRVGCRCGSSSPSSSSYSSPSITCPATALTQLPRVAAARPSKGPVFVVGGIAVDVLGKPTNPESVTESNVVGLSIPGQISVSAGGVGRNIAETLTKFGMATTLVSVIGTGPESAAGVEARDGVNHANARTYKPDYFGSFLLEDCRKKGIGVALSLVRNESTAVYSALSYSSGKFRGGVAHMSILDHMTPAVIDRVKSRMAHAKLIVIDANIPAATIEYVLEFAACHNIPTMFEPTSAAKVVKLAQVRNLRHVTYIKPNLTELRALACVIDNKLENSDKMDPNVYIKVLLNSGIQHVLLTQGDKPVHLGTAAGIKEFDIEKTNKVVDVNGAGDSLASGFLFGVLSGLDLDHATRLGLRAARLTVESPLSVSPLISPQLLYEFATPAAAL